MAFARDRRGVIVKTDASRHIGFKKKIHSRLEGRSPFGIGRRVFRQTPVRDKRRGCLIDKQVFTEEIIRRYFECACARACVLSFADACDDASVREKNLPCRSTRAFVCPPRRNACAYLYVGERLKNHAFKTDDIWRAHDWHLLR